MKNDTTLKDRKNVQNKFSSVSRDHPLRSVFAVYLSHVDLTWQRRIRTENNQ